MRYNSIIKNDTTGAPGICVSVYLQGCENHCKGCHNPETWDFNGGTQFTEETMQEIINVLKANGVQRSLAILGGEPLHKKNAPLTELIIKRVKEELPQTKIYIWTGFVYENLLESNDKSIQYILREADTLIDGPFVLELRDITLNMRGSSNQRIINLKK